jgi:3-polyprenyl-4-hydroxybenzoate decarboxylase
MWLLLQRVCIILPIKPPLLLVVLSSLDDVIHYIVARTLDQFGLEAEFGQRWHGVDHHAEHAYGEELDYGL